MNVYRTVYRVVLWVLTITCAIVILGLSLQTRTESAALSTGLTASLLNMFPSYRDLDPTAQNEILENMHFLIRELAHIVEFTVLSFFASLLAHSYHGNGFWLWSIPATVLFAVVDECVQQWCTVMRSFQVIDLIKDWMGCLVGAAIVWGILKYIQRQKS